MLDDIGAALRDGLSLVATFIPKLLLFLIILLIGWLVAKALRGPLSGGGGRDPPALRRGTHATSPVPSPDPRSPRAYAARPAAMNRKDTSR